MAEYSITVHGLTGRMFKGDNKYPSSRGPAQKIVIRRETAARSEATAYGDSYQPVTRKFADWLDTTSFSGTVAIDVDWASPEAWPSPDTMRNARACYEAFMAGDLAEAEAAMIRAQQAFV